MIKIITGDTAGFTFSIVSPGAVDSTPAPDLSAASIKFMLKRSIDLSDYKAAFSQTIVHPDTNILHFEMSGEDTGALVAGTYKAGCKIYYDDGPEHTLWEGDVMVVKGVFNA